MPACRTRPPREDGGPFGTRQYVPPRDIRSVKGETLGDCSNNSGLASCSLANTDGTGIGSPIECLKCSCHMTDDPTIATPTKR